MVIDRIRELRQAEPFSPFFVVLDDGRRLLVAERHHVGLAPDGSRFGVVTADGISLFRPEQLREVDVRQPSSGKQ